MTSSPPPKITTAERLRQLKISRDRVLALPSHKALAAIFAHPQPAALVHSFAEEDLHFLIHDIGLEEAMPLIALASNRQWDYFLDAEAWFRDRVNVPQATAWLHLLLRADADRLVRWCFEDKLDFLELFLFRNIEVRVRESDQSPSDLGEGFFTDDDTYYVRFVDYPAATEQEEAAKALRNETLSHLLRRLSRYDHPRYQGLLLEAAAIIPSESEEELFRLRNVRLGEKGFLPFDEAIGVYQPLRPEDLASRGRKVHRRHSPDDSRLPVPQFADRFLSGDNLFVRSLKGITEAAVVQQLQTELAGLCNQVISADQIVIRGRHQLQTVVAKVSGYVSIGLERIADVSGEHAERQARAAIRKYLLADIFRIGFACALDLKWQADRWYRQSWCRSQKIDLTFWQETWLGQLGGLLIDRPQFYDPSQPDANYRDFETLAQIDQTRNALNQVKTLDQLFKRLKVKGRDLSGHSLITYKNLLLTLWARTCSTAAAVGAEASGVAISLHEFKRIFDTLWTSSPTGRIIGDERKTVFLQWAAETSGHTTLELSERLGRVFEDLFDEVEEELATVTAPNLATKCS